MRKFVMTLAVSSLVAIGVNGDEIQTQEEIVSVELPAELEPVESTEPSAPLDQLYAYEVENPFESDEDGDYDDEDDDEDLGRSPYSNSMFA